METEQLMGLISEMKTWGENVAENSTSKYLDKIQTAAFLSECGANLEAISSHNESMKSWTDKGMSDAMKAIWGKKWEDIKKWNEDYIKEYEETTGHKLPSIAVGKKQEGVERPRSKQSSMKHVLGMMTRWASLNSQEDPDFTEERFREEIEVRVSNGLLRLQGVNSKEDLISLERPDTKEIYHPSLPPDYPLALIDYMLRD